MFSSVSFIASMGVTAQLLPTVASAGTCTSDLNCSLNGVCNTGTGVCACDKPWGGDRCGVLQYKKGAGQAAVGKDIFPKGSIGAPKNGPCRTYNTTHGLHICTGENIWGGPIVEVDGKWHAFLPVYPRDNLFVSYKTIHGVADAPSGPYTFTDIPSLGGDPNPALVPVTENGTTTYYYFTEQSPAVYSSTNISGPYTKVDMHNSLYNPSAIFRNGKWYGVSQRTMQISTADTVGAKGRWHHYADIKPHLSAGNNGPNKQEDPHLWVDSRGNWHIINHAYNTEQHSNCASSTLSAHSFSNDDGKTWHMLEDPHVEPYSHTVEWDDGTTHRYATLERPWPIFNADGVMTHLHVAADMVTQNGGCAHYPWQTCGRVNHTHPHICACAACKYANRDGTIIITLDI